MPSDLPFCQQGPSDCYIFSMAAKTSRKAAKKRGAKSRGSQTRRIGETRTEGRSASTAPRAVEVGNSRADTARKRDSGRSAKKGLGKPPAASRVIPDVTVDHDEIRRWAEERGGRPACVKGTGRGRADIGLIRLDFPGFPGAESVEPITWEQFFDAFEKNRLAFVFQRETAGGQRSNFNKIVARAEEE